MSSFTTELKLSPNDDGRTWRLLEAFEYHVGDKGGDEVVRVPAGFETDFASVPRFFWRIFPPWGSYGKATVIHDYCYRVRPCSRKRADKIFLEAMKVLGVGYCMRHTMYRAVRMFGGWAWRKNKKKGNDDVCVRTTD